MGRLGRVGIIAGVGVALVGGAFAVTKIAEDRVRENVDKVIADMGLSDDLSYRDVSLNLLTRQVTVKDVVMSEQGQPVLRVDRVSVDTYSENAQGQMVALTGGIQGLHMPFAQWAKDCAERGIACQFSDSAEDALSQGVENAMADMNVSYQMDDAARRMKLMAGFTMRDYIEMRMQASVGGVNTANLVELGDTLKDAVKAGVPLPMAVMIYGMRGGQDISQLDVGELGFSMKDLGALRKQAEAKIKAGEDSRSVEDIMRADLQEAQDEIKASAEDWMPAAFVDQAAQALEPFVLQGKPYRIQSHETAPLVLLKRGAQGFEGGYSSPVDVFNALGLKVDNAPL